MKARLLLAEDDARIGSLIERGLTAAGFEVDWVRDGRAALEAAMSGQYSLLILDRRLPQLEGMEVTRRLRDEGCRSRVLMLTAMDRLQDKVEGLRGGADDYLTKPFAFDELLARIAALLRRDAEENSERVLQVADLQVNVATKSATRDGRSLSLTAREFHLLVCLVERADTVVSREQLRKNVWGLQFDPGTKIVDVYIRYLRRKVDLPEARPLIHTVRGFGYMLTETPP